MVNIHLRKILLKVSFFNVIKPLNVKFSINNWSTQAKTLNIALTILKFEAFLYIGFYSLICWCIIILTSMLIYFSIVWNRRMVKNHHRTIRIQKAIKEIAQFKLSPQHFRTIKPSDMLGNDFTSALDNFKPNALFYRTGG